MPTTPEAIIADINEAAAAGFRGTLIARGQARAIIWRDGVLPPDAPDFAPQLGSGLIDQSQKMTVAARAMAEKKTVGHRS